MAIDPTKAVDPIPMAVGGNLFITRPPAGRRSKMGLDVLLTKAAVDFQNPPATGAEETIRQNLDAVREAAGLDTFFIAHFDHQNQVINKVIGCASLFATFNPEIFNGQMLDDLPYLRDRLEHIRVVEIRDTANPRRELTAESKRFAGLQVGAVLLAGYAVAGRITGFIAMCSTRPRESWDANLHLALKLLASSYASGLERKQFRSQFDDLEERSELALHGANDGLWDFDLEKTTTYFSPRWKSMLGYSDEEVEPLVDWQQLVHPEDLPRVQSALRDHLSGKEPMFESVHRLKHRDGVWLWVVSRAKARVDEHGRTRRIVGVDLDVTERKLYEEALFREKESAQITLQSIGDGVITTDSNCRIEYLNPVAEQLTGWRLEHAQGRVIDEIFRSFHEETCEPLENPLAVSIRRTRAIKSVRPTLLIRRDGNELYIESCASPIRDGSGVICGGVLVFHDVSESRELNRKLSYHASHDILTGLVNRREFESRLERAMKSARAREASFALCHIDLDQFKIINDNCGHSAGDALLGQVGALLKSKIRWRDTVARLGGDEFGVLLESCSLEEAIRSAESLREAIRNYKFVWEERTFRLGASIGVVPLSPENEDVASLLSAADSACAAAKESGRNRVYSFQENDIDLMRRRREMQWAARINNALEDSRFEIYRQVIQPLQVPDQGLHYELLLRMRDEAGKIVAPDQFIAAAERYGLTPNIDRWMIEHALRWLVSEADEREKLAMCSINLSGQSLGDDKFLPFVIDHFHRSGIDASKICFEITETAAIASFSQANRFIHALKELGCRFALDDFGTGLSSFGYLKHFPVDFLKIDGSFVKEILHDPIDREMVRSINEIGHLTGKQTIAEFAENAEIIEMLRSLGVDYAQGFGIATPQRVMRAAAGGG
ncbi:diguanylate cyclase (GGDEF)-like protein/PAS domain S-box-containing protein [Povalibacter uvarum]|uniref:Diguanylate cyclase (GGDEF)-like protein/PAS domain S-box-containing protein n=1 Tax=Povalibacter uvarum TaxID=732238 RepID=A0A841HF24_9GAMM|nr:EAL domain-containing protein [Povalibacter uvarum]MBB6091356.1 diguanylate cyclase (GGDEF)-like protein/PAS domain S-box-containing protein [Povalibacter uvarum]